MRIPHTQLHPAARIFFTLVVASAIFTTPGRAQETAAPAQNNQKWNYDELKKAPENARLRQNPLENDPNAIAAGGKLFQRDCSECHGQKAEGGKHAPSLLRDEVQQATPGTLFWLLTKGVVWHGMPLWSKLPEPERWQIVRFLKSLRASPAPPSPGGGPN
jgi:mono/diheme cytochrome c family protein